MKKKMIFMLCTMMLVGSMWFTGCGNNGNDGSEAPYQDETQKKVNENRLHYTVGLVFCFGLLCVRYGIYACLFLVFAHSFITNDAVYESEQGVILADTDVCARMNFRTALTNENVACEYGLAVAALRAKAFRFAVSPVVGRTGTFLMSE